MKRSIEEYRQLPAKRMAAGALILHQDLILVVQPTYKDTWEIPGGIVECDESPKSALKRELTEELGISLEPGRLLLTEYQSGSDSKTESLMFVFEAQIRESEINSISLPENELRSYRFVDLCDLDDLLVDRLARRVRFALSAYRENRFLYLEDGREA